MMDAKAENTFWRDGALSLRHKKWGYDLPALDMDFLMIEYDHGIPVALIEYKLETTEGIATTNQS